MNKLIYIVQFFIFVYIQTSEAVPQLDSSTEKDPKFDDIPVDKATVNTPSLDSGAINLDLDPGGPKLDLDPHFGGNQTNSCEHECVPFYLCKNGSINTNGEGIINIREKQDLPCSDAFQVCCRPEDKSTEPLTTTPPPKPARKGCGYRHPDGVGFKITGNKDGEAQYAEFPWMVAIFRDTESLEPNQRPKCGGALIHPQAVITAAHCVSSRSDNYTIRAGEWDINRRIEPHSHQDVAVKSVTLHPHFYSGALYNDIAFLHLEKPVQIAENVGLICLPKQNHQQTAQVGRCYLTGWGKDRFGKKGVYHIIMKKVDLPLVPRDICQNNLRKTRLKKYFKLHESFICAGGEEGKDACDGDGGSPLVCPIEGQEGRYYHAGIVAWGIGCGEKDVPGVYANVASFRDWIDEQMLSKELDPSTYKHTPGFDERGSFL